METIIWKGSHFTLDSFEYCMKIATETIIRKGSHYTSDSFEYCLKIATEGLVTGNRVGNYLSAYQSIYLSTFSSRSLNSYLSFYLFIKLHNFQLNINQRRIDTRHTGAHPDTQLALFTVVSYEILVLRRYTIST